MKLECYLPDGVEIDIHPASRRRSWMDNTPDAFAYRCLPLSIANAHGWEIRCPAALEAEWNGGPKPGDVEVFHSGDRRTRVSGHFGSGTLTFEPYVIFRTSPGYNLWVTGPVNTFKDGIQPFSAVVETDWIPFPFSMNWKLTRTGHRIRFEEGEPYCFLFPVRRGLVEEVEPELKQLTEDETLKRRFQYARNLRTFNTSLKQLRGLEADEHRFQRWYMQGKQPDGSGRAPEHQKSLSLKQFSRKIDLTKE